MGETGQDRVRVGVRRWMAPAAVVSVVALIGAACGGGSSTSSSSSTSGGANKASAPGITANSITIGSHQPLTGVAAPGYDEIAPSAKALFDDVNAHGGVNGRKITYNYQDDAYNPTNTATVVRSLVLQDNVFAILNGLGTPTHLAVQQFLNTERVPDLFVASGCDCWNNPSKFPYTSGYQTDYTIEGKITGQYIKNNFAGKKVGYLYQNDDFGQGGVQGLDQQVPKSSVVTRQTYVPTNLDVGPQVAALQSSGAQVAVLYTVPPFTALTLAAAAKIGYHPQWVTSSVSADPTTVGNLLKGTSMLEGLVLTACGWVFLGASLWAVLCAIMPEPPALTPDSLAHYSALLALAYVAGFIIFVVPSGLGIREFFLTLYLLPDMNRIFAGDNAKATAAAFWSC